MISRLEGILAEKSPDEVILDIGGVGYEVRVPVSTFLELPDEGKTVCLRIHTHVREESFALYGFLHDVERVCFRLLIGISGVGPRLALTILSGLPIERLLRAIRAGDLASLVGIPGVGKKTAERLLVDLRDSVSKLELADASSPSADDAESACLSALLNLGYPRAHAEKALRTALEELPSEPSLEALIKEALRAAAG